MTQKQINCVLNLPQINSITNITNSELQLNVTLPIDLTNNNFFDANITSTRVKVSTKSNGTEVVVSSSKNRPWHVIPKRTLSESIPSTFFVNTTIRFGDFNHLGLLLKNCLDGIGQKTLPVTLWVSMNITIQDKHASSENTQQQQTYLFDFCTLPCDPSVPPNSTQANC